MTGICALIGREPSDLEAKTKTVLKLMERRGTNFHTFSQSLPNDEKLVLGICAKTDLNPFQGQTAPIALDGVFFGDDDSSTGRPAGPGWLVQTPGAFAFLAVVQDRLIAGRDILGQKPLYCGVAENGISAVASLRSPLASIGISSVRPVSPGTVTRISSSEIVAAEDFSLKLPMEEPIAETEAIIALAELFKEAVQRILPRHSGVAFSGGLDSGIVAKVAKTENLEPVLISVGMKGQQELMHAERVSKDLGLQIVIQELSESDVLDSLPEVVGIIETTDPTIVAISVPIHFACEKAREIGLQFFAAGQLSDELFGGYGRFEDMALKNQMESVGKEMFDSVVAASANDFDPGDKLAVAAGLELCCPFAYLPLAQYALRLPTSLRVRKWDGKIIRKYILRRLASDLKLPDSVVDRPKKAVQYSSGVQKVMLKEAKRQKTTISEMLTSIVS